MLLKGINRLLPKVFYYAVAFSGFLSAGTADAQFLEFQNETIGFTEGIEGVRLQAFSSDNHFLYTCSSPGLAVFEYSGSGKVKTIQVIRADNFGLQNYTFNSFELSVDEKYVYTIAHSIYSDEKFPSVLFVFERSASTGRLSYVAEYSLERNVGGEIKRSPDGKHLYVSTAGIRTYSIDQTTGKLDYLGTQLLGESYGGVWISSDGKFLYSQASSYYNTYTRNSDTGALTLLETDFSIPRGRLLATKSEKLVFITGGSGIIIFNRNTTTGQLTKVGVHKDPVVYPNNGPGPSGVINMVITGDDEFLHVLGIGAGNFTSYMINALDGSLTLLDTKTIGDFYNGAWSLSKTADEKSVFLAHSTNAIYYGLVQYVQDNSGILHLADSVYFGETIGNGLAEISASILTHDGNTLYVFSKGDSSLSAYNTNHADGSISLANQIAVKDFHLNVYLDRSKFITSPDDKFLYVLNEPDNHVLIFQRNDQTSEINYVSALTLPETPSFNSRLKMSASGKWLYVIAGGKSVLVYSRDDIAGTLNYSYSLDEFNGIAFESIRDVEVSGDNKTLYLVGTLTDGTEELITYILDDLTGSLQFLKDSSIGRHENCHHCIGNELLIPPDGTSLYVYHSEDYRARVDIYYRNPDNGILDSQIVDNLEIDRFQFTYSGEYVLAGSKFGVRFYKRDFEHKGKLIDMGEQLTAGEASVFYAQERTELYHVKPDNKTILGVRSRGSVWTYTYADQFPPLPPAHLVLQNDIAQIKLYWNANAESDDVQTYEIFFSRSVDELYQATKLGETSDTLFLYASENTEYNFWVRAKNSDGSVSMFSNQVQGHGLNAIPSQPGGLSASGADKYIYLHWNTNTESDLDKYLVYRNITDDSSSAILVAATEYPFYNDYSVDYDVLYFYWIKAKDDLGLLSAFDNKTTSAIPINLPPAKPQFFSAVSNDNENVLLEWAHNNVEPDFSKYVLSRNTVLDFVLANNLAEVMSTTYTDTPEASGEYYYWLQAVDNMNNKSVPAGPLTVNYEKLVTGILDPELSNGIHPNPADKVITINSFENSSYDFIVLNNTGEIVLRGSKNDNVIDVSKLQSGLYILHVKSKTRIMYYRFVKSE